MDAEKALAIIKSLANGFDPDGGAVLDATHNIVCRPDVVRALYRATLALDYHARAEKRKTQLPARTGEPWTEDEDRKLLSHFDSGKCLADLATSHSRTQTGIRARLVKYGRLAA